MLLQWNQGEYFVWVCTSVGRNKKILQNYGGKTSWKTKKSVFLDVVRRTDHRNKKFLPKYGEETSLKRRCLSSEICVVSYKSTDVSDIPAASIIAEMMEAVSITEDINKFVAVRIYDLTLVRQRRSWEDIFKYILSDYSVLVKRIEMNCLRVGSNSGICSIIGAEFSASIILDCIPRVV